VSGGVLQGASADVKEAALEVFDADNKKAEGKDADQIEDEWQRVKKKSSVRYLLKRRSYVQMSCVGVFSRGAVPTRP